jgi:ubiquinone biosynthesis protein UbiJ
MNTTSPFSFLESFAQHLQPPAWLVAEGQQRLVLFLNHVLLQEKEAQTRLARHSGSVVHLRWGAFALDLLITPAGLTDRAPSALPADLTLTVAMASPWLVLQSVFQGKTPPVKIEGDVQLAAELGWLADNLRWDVEEDLSRILGDVSAHAIVGAGQRVLTALRDFLAGK